jgi:hypothetical protein
MGVDQRRDPRDLTYLFIQDLSSPHPVHRSRQLSWTAAPRGPLPLVRSQPLNSLHAQSTGTCVVSKPTEYPYNY